jgi:hypothetical protein
MRSTDAIADSIGVMLLIAVASVPLSCAPKVVVPSRLNLQPDVSVFGAYGVAQAADAPSPPPTPSVGCAVGCKCNGTGFEKSGDGLAVVGCRCDDTCSCKARKAGPTAGRPGWPPKSTAR